MRKDDYRWGLIVVLLAVLGGLGGFALSRKQHPYSATASLVFQPDTVAQSILGDADPSSNETSEEQATQVLLVNRAPVIAAAIRQLGLNATVADVQSRVSTASEGSSNVVDVTAKAPGPGPAMALANAVVDQFVAQQQRATAASVAAAQRGLAAHLSHLQRQPRSAATLTAEQSVQTEQAELAALSTINAADVAVLQRATGAGRTGHSRKSLIAIGIVVGLIVGLVLIWLVFQIRRSRRGDSELELHGFADRTFLSLSRSARRRSANTALPASDAARIDHLAVILDLGPGDEQRVVLCAPADSSAERFDLAWRLAQAGAGLGARTLYVTLADRNGHDQTLPISVAANLSTFSIPGVGSDLNDRLRAMVQADGRPFDAIVIAGFSLADDAMSLRLAARADSVVLFSLRQSPTTDLVAGSLSALGHVGASRPTFVSTGTPPT